MHPEPPRQRVHPDTLRAACSHSVHFLVAETCSRSSPWLCRRVDERVIRLPVRLVHAAWPLIPRGNKPPDPLSPVPVALHCAHHTNTALDLRRRRVRGRARTRMHRVSIGWWRAGEVGARGAVERAFGTRRRGVGCPDGHRPVLGSGKRFGDASSDPRAPHGCCGWRHPERPFAAPWARARDPIGSGGPGVACPDCQVEHQGRGRREGMAGLGDPGHGRKGRLPAVEGRRERLGEGQRHHLCVAGPGVRGRSAWEVAAVGGPPRPHRQWVTGRTRRAR